MGNYRRQRGTLMEQVWLNQQQKLWLSWQKNTASGEEEVSWPAYEDIFIELAESKAQRKTIEKDPKLLVRDSEINANEPITRLGHDLPLRVNKTQEKQ